MIEPELFYKVQQVRSRRLIPMRNSGKRMANLFTGIAFCGHCGALMHYENKGKTARESKGGFGCGSYLVCSNARRKVRLEDGSLCKAHRWKYPQLQCHIIMNLLEVDFRELYPRMYQSTNENLKRLEGEILRAGGELERTEKALERILDALIDAGKSPTLLAKLNELEKRKLKLTQELASLEDQDALERAQSTNIDRDHRAASEALERLLDTEDSGTPEEILESRRRLHQLLKKVIDRIVFEPATAGSVHVNPSLYRGEPQPIHGKIRVYFKLAGGGYHREIYVRSGNGKTDPNGQKESWGYKVESGRTPELHVAVDDAKWPPEGRLITGPGLWNEVAGIYLK